VVADRIGASLQDNPRLVLGLPTGRTTVPLYRELVRLARRGRLDFSRATTFNLDEFVGLPPDHRSSFRAFMNHHFFDAVNINRNRINFLNGMAEDLKDECERFEAAIERAGGLDIQVLGVGVNGHIGFNEPGDTLQARTHMVVLRPETRRANVALFGGRTVPRHALSMGMGTILRARSIVLIATGRNKARAVRQMVSGPLTTRLPASFLQVHRNVEVVLDEAAAGQLTG
jgi:glucosamine-6-phosphate deaminase